MPPEIIPSDEEYLSEEDSDFAPDAIPTQNEAESDSESEPEEAVVATKPQKKRKRAEDEEAEDLGFENSGDEAIIGDGLKEKKRRRKGKKGKGKGKGKEGEDEDEDEGGEGGFVKTRSMRAVEEVKKKPLADTSAATIDVDAVWAAMLAGKPLTTNTTSPPPASESAILSPQSPSKQTTSSSTIPEVRKDSRSPSTLSEGPDAMIMIKRTYTFAGKIHTEQKLVPRNSAEARLYLSSQPQPQSDPSPSTSNFKPEDSNSTSPFTKPKRPLKLARRSIFEPIPDHLPLRKDLHFGIRRSETGVALVEVRTGKEKEKKLNTVEKSAMDWAGFVDQEGIQDELQQAGKSKGAYRARQEFLARVEAKKIEEDRRVRGLPVL
ncbi:hypothetical protein EG329_008463 [Mollisiaceae sp. DMI_Dod_QoI]|nr:hypothetical protein EG329_008463 [Helotiales sp. DMI_Dod_QoI]